MRKHKRKAAALFAAVLLTAVGICACDCRLKVVHYRIDTERLSAPLRLALLTDLHSCSYGEGQKTLLDAISAQKPDAVLLGGDIFDDENDPAPTFTLLSAIVKKYPCYYVTGNHEIWSTRADAYKAWLRENGAIVLEGTASVLQVGDASINICGVDDLAGCADADAFRSQLQSAADAAGENGSFSILLAHRPEEVETYLSYGFDLILSGHAHGGQWRIPGILNGFYAPGQGLFPAYAGGEYRFPKATLLVSRGLARFDDLAPRLFNRPELVIVELK